MKRLCSWSEQDREDRSIVLSWWAAAIILILSVLAAAGWGTALGLAL